MNLYLLFSILIAIAAILLILIVLVQNSKGGGLASNFSSSNQIMGVRKTTDFLEKATWTLSIAILVLSVVAAASIDHEGGSTESMIKDQIEEAVDPSVMPNFPTQLPADNSPATTEEKDGE